MSVDYKSLFETAPDLYLVLSPDLTIIGASDAYLQATLTRREEIMDRGLFDVFPDNPEDHSADGAANLNTSLTIVLQTKAAHVMAIQKYDIRRPDGVFEERYWRPLNTPVLDAKNEVQYIIHKVEDVTESSLAQKRFAEDIRRQEQLQSELEQTVRDSDDRFYHILNLSPVVFIITNVADGKLQYVNKAFETLFLLKSIEVVGKTLSDLGITDETNRDNHVKYVKEQGAHGVEAEQDLRAADGMIKKVLTTAELIIIDGKECFIKVMIDITERTRQQYAILQLNKELEAFSYSVSHDLRAPLRAVTGFARMLDEDYSNILDAEGRRLLHTISDNAVKMGRLIDELLRFSKLGRKELVVRDTDMNAVVAEAIREINKSVVYQAEIKCDHLHQVKSDPALMAQVMINLIGNAIKYSSKKEHATVEIKSQLEGNTVIFSVKDNGAGFDMRYVDKLFGVFQRLHTTDEFDGSGVGLAIVHRIVTSHGGKVWAEGKVGEGATIYFSLPNN